MYVRAARTTARGTEGRVAWESPATHRRASLSLLRFRRKLGGGESAFRPIPSISCDGFGAIQRLAGLDRQAALRGYAVRPVGPGRGQRAGPEAAGSCKRVQEG